MTLSQKPRWPLILSMKSASERRCRRRKSGGQTGRGKQHIANAACFDLSTQASQIMPSNSAFITLRMFIKHQLYARHYAMKWKGHAWPRGSHPSMCVCVCVCVCVFMPVCTQGVSSLPCLWASSWNIWPHGCLFSVLRGFMYSWVVSLSSTGLSYYVFLSLPNLFSI